MVINSTNINSDFVGPRISLRVICELTSSYQEIIH